MAYSIRRWISMNGMLIDDTRKARTEEETIKACQQLAGIFASSIITDDVKAKIKAMEPGETLKIKKTAAKLTLRIKRLKT